METIKQLILVFAAVVLTRSEYIRLLDVALKPQIYTECLRHTRALHKTIHLENATASLLEIQ